MTFSIVIPFKQRCPYQCNLTSNGIKSLCVCLRAMREYKCEFVLLNGKRSTCCIVILSETSHVIYDFDALIVASGIVFI